MTTTADELETTNRLARLEDRVEALERERDEARAAAAKAMENMPAPLRKMMAKVMGGEPDS